jgi:hypothetical protein
MRNSHNNLLFRNHWVNSNQTLVEWSLDSLLPKLCPVIPAFNQDGCQAGLKCRIQFWKGTTQGSSQQSLVETGSVVSEENIFFKFHPPLFLFLAWRSPWLEVGITGHHHKYNCCAYYSFLL